MLFHSKRFSSFMTGCLAALVIFGYPSQLLAQTNTLTDPIQGVTSTTQSPPSNAAEIADAITGINAGLSPIDVGDFSPDPIREHTKFLSDVWATLLDSNYINGTSYLITDEWISGSPSGSLSAHNENGHSVAIDVALSLEILPSEWGADQDTLNQLADNSIRFGIAWTTMSNQFESAHILVWWAEWMDSEGTSSAIGPLTTLSQDEIDLMLDIVPLMEDFYDDPLNYNFGDDTLLAPAGLWSDFRSAVSNAKNSAIGTIVGTTVAGILTVGLTIAGGATAAVVGTVVTATGATMVGIVVGALVVVHLVAEEAYNRLKEKLRNMGWDVDNMSRDQIIELARLLYH